MKSNLPGCASLLVLAPKRVWDGLIRLFEGGLEVLRDALSEGRGPFRFTDVVDDDSQMPQVERDVLHLGRRENDWLLRGMSQAKLVKDVGVAVCQVCKQESGFLDLLPN